jgi:hypothetical protein
MLDSTAASPARKRQRTSLPGTLDEATTTQLAQRMAPKRFSSPSGSQRIPGSSQSQHGRQARLKAIADALANESISEVSPLISRCALPAAEGVTHRLIPCFQTRDIAAAFH